MNEEQLKRRAKKAVKESRASGGTLTHSQALEALCRQLGFESYAAWRRHHVTGAKP